MRVLVAGGTGLLGREIVKQLLAQHDDVWIPIHKRKSIFLGAHSIHMDFRSLAGIREAFLRIRPDIVINCIVERRVDICEKDWAAILEPNVNIPTRLAQMCEEFSSHFIHISTDYVFDGRKPPFTPTSLCNPCNAYGMSKLLSELRVASFCPSSTILRVPVLYSDSILSLDENAVTMLGKLVMNQMTSVKEDGRSLRRPVYIPDFSKYIVSLTKEKPSGILHYGNSDVCVTKLDIIHQIARILEVGSEHITAAEDSPLALRPYDTHLVDPHVKTLNVTPFHEVLQRTFSRWKHPKLFEKENAKKFFLLLDLDGTLVDTDALHISCYKEVGVIADNLVEKIRKGELQVPPEVKAKKTDLFCEIAKQSGRISWLPGAEALLNYCLDWNVNLCIVTNTTRKSVEAMATNLPQLQHYVKQGRVVCREDYAKAKPSPDSYDTAYKIFYKGEPYILGFENTNVGVQALETMNARVCTYAVNPGVELQDVRQTDCFIIPSLLWLWERKPIA